MSGRRRRAQKAAAEQQAAALAAEPAAAAEAAGQSMSALDMLSIIIACVLVLWRAQAYPIGGIWHDWVVIVSAWWVFTVLAGRSRAWAPVTVAFMGVLLAIFAYGNVPQVLAPFGWKP